MAKSKTNTLVLTMSQDKETKNAVRYAAESENGGYPKNIYFSKAELEENFGKRPSSLKVTIEPED